MKVGGEDGGANGGELNMFQRRRVVVLFNAWFPNDAVYIEDSEHRCECSSGRANDFCIVGVACQNILCFACQTPFLTILYREGL